MATDAKQIIKITGELGELKGKVDQMDKNLTANFTSLEKRVVDMHNSVKTVISEHEGRINAVEENCAQSKGRTAGIAIAVSLIVSILTIISIYLAIKGIFK